MQRHCHAYMTDIPALQERRSLLNSSISHIPVAFEYKVGLRDRLHRSFFESLPGPNLQHLRDHLAVLVGIDVPDLAPAHLDHMYAMIRIWCTVWENEAGVRSCPPNNQSRVPRPSLTTNLV